MSKHNFNPKTITCYEEFNFGYEVTFDDNDELINWIEEYKIITLDRLKSKNDWEYTFKNFTLSSNSYIDDCDDRQDELILSIYFFRMETDDECLNRIIAEERWELEKRKADELRERKEKEKNKKIEEKELEEFHRLNEKYGNKKK